MEGKPDQEKLTVTLRKITSETVRTICRLSETLPPAQQKMVAPNAVSVAQAYFEERAWFRAIYAGEEPVGFVMLHDDPEEHEYFLWRFMIAYRHQGKSYGREALKLLIEYVRTRPGATEFMSNLPWAAGAVLSFGGLAIALDPPELRETVQEWVAYMAQQYETERAETDE